MKYVVMLGTCLLISACTKEPMPDATVMPIGDEVTGHQSEVEFCKREPEQCDTEDDGGL